MKVRTWVILVTLGLLVSARAVDAGSVRVYVSPTGDDASVDPRDPKTPLKSLRAACGAVNPGETLEIAEGVYREELRLNGKRGTAELPIVVEPAKGARVVLSGTSLVRGPWTAVPGKPNVYSAEWSGGFKSVMNQTEQLFVDGQMLHLARFPNATPGELFEPDRMLEIQEVVKQEQLSPGTPTPWGPVLPRAAQRLTIKLTGPKLVDGAWDGGTLFTIPRDTQGMGWGFGSVGPIVSTKDGQLEAYLYFGVKGNGHSPLIDVSAGDPVYLVGRLQALDAPGEWYHDSEAGLIYVYLPDGSDPTEHVVEYKRRDFAIDLSDSSYVTVRGVEVFGATATTDREFGRGVGGGEWVGGGRGSDTGPTGNAAAHHNTFDGVHFRYINHFLGTWGNPHGQWLQASGVSLVGRNHTLRNCEIEYSAGNGVVLYGPGHRVSNNVIHGVSYSAAHASGIYIQQTAWDPKGEQIYAFDCEIDHNSIYRTGWGGIDASKLYSTDPKRPFRIHHNRIEAAGLLTQDVGGIRVVSRPEAVAGDKTRHEPAINGTRIDHNLIRYVVAPLGNAIYFDYCEGYVCDHNVVTDSEGFICVNQSGKMTVANNTGWRARRGLGGLVNGKPTNLNFTDLYVVNNVLNDVIQKADERTDPTYKVENNIERVTASAFTDAAGGDLRPAKGSELIGAGKSLGVLDDGKAGTAPDIGALRHDEENWLATVGADWQNVRAPTELKGTASPDGTVKLSWKDNSDNETGFVVEIGSPVVGHQRPGWDFRLLARVGANVTSVSAKLELPCREYMYRVRADRSYYSSCLYLASGVQPACISFRAEEGYTPGPVVGVGPWISVHGGEGPSLTPVSFAVVTVDDTGLSSLDLVGDGKTAHSRRSLAVLGNAELMDSRFKQAESSIRFSMVIGMKAVQPGVNETVAEFGLGGLGYWRSPDPTAASIRIRADGSVALVGMTTNELGKLPVTGAGMVAPTVISGVVDLARRSVTQLKVGDTLTAHNLPLANDGSRFEAALWQIDSMVTNPKYAVQIFSLQQSVEP